MRVVISDNTRRSLVSPSDLSNLFRHFPGSPDSSPLFWLNITPEEQCVESAVFPHDITLDKSYVYLTEGSTSTFARTIGDGPSRSRHDLQYKDEQWRVTSSNYLESYHNDLHV